MEMTIPASQGLQRRQLVERADVEVQLEWRAAHHMREEPRTGFRDTRRFGPRWASLPLFQEIDFFIRREIRCVAKLKGRCKTLVNILLSLIEADAVPAFIFSSNKWALVGTDPASGGVPSVNWAKGQSIQTSCRLTLDRAPHW